MKETLFSFSGYKAYLRRRLGGPGSRPGIKTALAGAIGCQPTYISQVLHSKAHLSLEQAESANQFFAHSKEEAHFFMLLLQKERAGTKALERYFDEQINEILQKRLVLTERLGAKQVLSSEHQSVYYSSWHYAAVHIGLTIPELRAPQALASYLQIPLGKISEVLDFLVSAGLAVEDRGLYKPGLSQIRLGKASHNIIKHHANWRMHSIESLVREELTDLHYSAVVSLSKQDVLKIKDRLLDVIDEIQKTVRDSKEEALCSVAFDFYGLKR